MKKNKTTILSFFPNILNIYIEKKEKQLWKKFKPKKTKRLIFFA